MERKGRFDWARYLGIWSTRRLDISGDWATWASRWSDQSKHWVAFHDKIPFSYSIYHSREVFLLLALYQSITIHWYITQFQRKIQCTLTSGDICVQLRDTVTDIRRDMVLNLKFTILEVSLTQHTYSFTHQYDNHNATHPSPDRLPHRSSIIPSSITTTSRSNLWRTTRFC